MITIAQYGILRFAKHKGGSARAIEAHHERQKEQYASNPDIDTGRSKHNYHLIQPSASYKNEIDGRITAAGCRTRKDSTRFVDTLVTASPEFFKGKGPKEIKAYFDHAADFLFRRVGKHNVLSAVVHMDEKTPHLHLCFVPLTEDNRLSARDILGNRASLSKWQDDFHAHMVQKYEDLERGQSAYETRRRHIPPRIFKQGVNLSKQADKIEQTIKEINFTNASKKRDEALLMLDKWFSQMERYMAFAKPYMATLQQLERENNQLAAKVEASKDNSIMRQLEISKMERQLTELQAFYKAVPDDVKQNIAAERRTARNHRQNRQER